MQHKDTFKTVKGRVEYCYVYPGNRWELQYTQHNLVTYQGSDILAKAVAGQLTLNGMYLVFRNNPAATPIPADKLNTAATYATVSADRSFVRVSAMGEPVFTSTTSDYQNNEVTFLAVTDGTSFYPSVPVTDGTSVFYHSALVGMPDFEDQSLDQIFSCADMTVPLTKIAGAQIGIRWIITFNTP